MPKAIALCVLVTFACGIFLYTILGKFADIVMASIPHVK